MSQIFFPNFIIKEWQRAYPVLDKFSYISKLLENYQYLTRENVDIGLQERIFLYLENIADELHQKELDSFRQLRDERLSNKGEYALKHYGFGDPLVGNEFDQRIIIWHIITEKCYSDGNANKWYKDDHNRKISKWLSDYMLYLMLFRPSMLRKGIGEIRYDHTYVDVERTYARTCEVPPSKQGCRAKKGITSNNYRFSLYKQAINCHSLLVEQAQGLFNQARVEQAQGLIELERGPDSHFRDLENGGEIRWDMISEVWLEMLAYATQNCDWKEHAQHLRNGGELLTHVSVLMVNFRLNKQVM